MELNIKVIELTNKVDMKLGLDKEFKELPKTSKEFMDYVKINYGSSTMLGGGNFFRSMCGLVNISYKTQVVHAWYHNNLPVAYLVYLMRKHKVNFKAESQYISTIKYPTKEVVEYFGLTEVFPKQLLAGSDFTTMLGFLPRLMEDKRSKFYKKDPQKLFDEL